jgi:hypothetical protein
MRIRSAVVFAALGCAPFAHGQQAVQWRTQDGGNGHWYRADVSPSPLSWETARSTAISAGGHLATLTSHGENAFVFALVSNRPECWTPNSLGGPWLGGFQPNPLATASDGWAWVSGEPWSYTNWATNEPNDGGGLYPESELHFLGNGRWNDYTSAGTQIYSLVIEWSTDCNGDGIVDYGQCRDGSLPDYDGDNVPDCCQRGAPCTVGNYPVQWRAEDGGNGHWYQAIPSGLISWGSARVAAEARGANLATATSAAENLIMFRVSAFPHLWDANFLGPWIGGFQPAGVSEPSGGWSWITGEAWTFSKWGPGQPDNGGSGICFPENGLHFLSPGHVGPESFWNDGSMVNSCVAVIGYVQEWSTDCDGNGIVDYGEILEGTLGDTNSNGIPDCCDAGVSCDPCPGDLNDSNTVDAEDLAAILFAWGTDGGKTPQADITRDGTVDGSDLAAVLGGWGPCPN